MENYIFYDRKKIEKSEKESIQRFTQALFATIVFHLRLSLFTVILNQQKWINK